MFNLVVLALWMGIFIPLIGGLNIAQSAFVNKTQSLLQQSATPSPGNQIDIISPNSGSALQGSVPVIVDTSIQDFKTVELSFKYSNDSTDTWFLIYQGIQPVTGTMLVLWDTSTITDGDYSLRMIVTFLDGSQESVEVEDLRVRNYSAVETSTPVPEAVTVSPSPIATLTSTLAITNQPTIEGRTPTSPPTNPVQLSQLEVFAGVGEGALLIIGLFALGGAYFGLRAVRRKR